MLDNHTRLWCFEKCPDLTRIQKRATIYSEMAERKTKFATLRVRRPTWAIFTELARQSGMSIADYMEALALSLAKSAQQEPKTE